MSRATDLLELYIKHPIVAAAAEVDGAVGARLWEGAVAQIHSSSPSQRVHMAMISLNTWSKLGLDFAHHPASADQVREALTLACQAYLACIREAQP